MHTDRKADTVQSLTLPTSLVKWMKEARNDGDSNLTSLASDALTTYLDAGPNGGASLLSECDGQTFRQIALLARERVFPGRHLKTEVSPPRDAEALLADPRNAALYAIAIEELRACRAEVAQAPRKRKRKRAKKVSGTSSNQAAEALGAPQPDGQPDSKPRQAARGRAKTSSPTSTGQLPLF